MGNLDKETANRDVDGGGEKMVKNIFNKNAFKIKTKANNSAIKYLDGGYYAELEVTVWEGGEPKTETIQIFRDCIGMVKAIRL